mmetsp:Transcript_3985/g.12389  ORF Transcript_3985/g.12389 Transcript_3985/m.12389 type:complete len:93 (-) Transcript_3985:775-1053(-)
MTAMASPLGCPKFRAWGAWSRASRRRVASAFHKERVTAGLPQKKSSGLWSRASRLRCVGARRKATRRGFDAWCRLLRLHKFGSPCSHELVLL